MRLPLALRNTGATVPADPLPLGRRDLEAIAQRCRRLVRQRAMLSASAVVVPMPGFDLLVDMGVLSRMLHEVNLEFGLTPAQIERLAPRRRLSVYRTVQALGTSAVGQLITRELLGRLLRSVARRAAAKGAARYVPLAGQAVAAALSFSAIRLIGERHIAECLRVADTMIDIDDLQ
jgi:uncharacterized protein (DUF697 family)